MPNRDPDRNDRTPGKNDDEDMRSDPRRTREPDDEREKTPRKERQNETPKTA